MTNPYILRCRCLYRSIGTFRLVLFCHITPGIHPSILASVHSAGASKGDKNVDILPSRSAWRNHPGTEFRGIPVQFRGPIPGNSGPIPGSNSGDSIPNCLCLSFSALAFAAAKHERPILPLSPKRLHLLKNALCVRVNGNIPSLQRLHHPL